MALTEPIDYSFQIESAPKDVWSFFWDMHAMAGCIPGCEAVTTIEEHQAYRADVRKKMGPFLIRMPLDIKVLESLAPTSIRVEVSGKDKRLRSEVSQKIAVSLGGADGGPTDVKLDISVTLSGILATLGKHLVRTQIQQSVDEFVDTLRRAITDRGSNPSH